MTAKEILEIITREGSFVISEEDTSSDEAIHLLLEQKIVVWSDEYDSDEIILA